MALSPRLALLFLLSPLSAGLACGGETFGVDPDGGGNGNGGSNGSGGDAATGGSTTGSGGGAANCGSTFHTKCEEDSDCVVAVNVCDPCYSPSCSAPQAAAQRDTLLQGCLRTWEQREVAPDPACLSSDDVACPAICAVVPECPTAVCVDQRCQLGPEGVACAGSGGTTGAGGRPGTGGTGGANSGGTGGLGLGIGGIGIGIGGVIVLPSDDAPQID